MAIDELTYPQPVLNRQGPPAGGGAAAPLALPEPPRSFVFGFSLRANQNTRSTTSTQKLRGPSIVRGLHFSKGGTPDGLQGPVLGKSLSAVAELNVAIDTPVPFTPLFTGLPGVGTVAGAPNNGLALVDFQANLLTDADDLGIIVLDRDWFLTITWACGNTGTPDDGQGYVTVLDEVPFETLRNFR